MEKGQGKKIKKRNGIVGWRGAPARLFVFTSFWGMGKNKNLKTGRKRNTNFFTALYVVKVKKWDKQFKKGNKKNIKKQEKTKQKLFIQLALRVYGLRSDGESGGLGWFWLLLFFFCWCPFFVLPCTVFFTTQCVWLTLSSLPFCSFFLLGIITHKRHKQGY